MDMDDDVGKVVEVDLPCVGCGYNLRTLEEGGKCPECGEAVARAVAHAAVVGQIGRPGRVAKAALVLAGAALVPAVPAGCFGVVALWMAPGERAWGVAFQVVMGCAFVAAAGVVAWVAGLLLSAGLPEPRPRAAGSVVNFMVFALLGAALSGGLAVEAVWGYSGTYHELLVLRRVTMVVLAIPTWSLVEGLERVMGACAARLEWWKLGQEGRRLFLAVRVYLGAVVVFAAVEIGWGLEVVPRAREEVVNLVLVVLAACGAALGGAWGVYWVGVWRGVRGGDGNW